MIQLKDICDIYDCPHTTAKDEGKGYPLVRTPNVGKGRLILDGIHRVSEDVYNSRNARAIPEEGDLILAREAPVGNVSIIMDGQRVCLGQRVVLIKPKRELVDPHFLTYYLLSAEVQHRLKNHANGAVVAHLNVSDIRNLWVTLPELEEQVAIGKILRSIDDKIELNRQINDNLEQQAQALYKSWFVDFEPFKDGAFKESEFGLIPEGWRVGSLSDLTEITMGQSPSGKSYNETGDGMLFYQGRAEFGDRYPSIRLYTTEPSRIAEQNSVLLSVRAPVGDTNIAYNKCCIGRGLASITAKHGFNSFIFYMIKSLKDQFDLYNGEGTVFGSINRDSLNSMKVIVPTNEVINDFEKIVAPLDFKYKSLFSENLLLKQQRDTLLPKLMSGELKINDLDC